MTVCQVQSQVFRAETETERDVALAKLELLDYHSQRGWVVSKTAPRLSEGSELQVWAQSSTGKGVQGT